ncbi:MAG: LysR family transcriptional regulator [Ruminococcaceae bacterium]|jgi:DNA-binding transcriptional LysR family regulator|nr:LysR family transcriptional regulator [Oscillospiraceae bacterium]
MTIRHLRIFIAVYQQQNMTRAARELHMTQPTVTRAIQELEDYYGVRLFERINRRLSITEGGRRLYAQAVHIVDSLELLEKELKNWDEVGVLRIGATPTLASTLLPQVLSDFEARHPNLRVRSTVYSGTYLEQALLDNELDLALIEGGIRAEHLLAESFLEDRLILLLPPDDPRRNAAALSLRDLAGSRFLMYESGSMDRSYLEHAFVRQGIPLEIAMESVSTHAIVQAVHMGLGVSFLPESLVRYSVESGFVTTRAVYDQQFERKCYLVRHENKYLTGSAAEVMDLCRRAAANIQPLTLP